MLGSLGHNPLLQPWAESWGPFCVFPFSSPQVLPFKAHLKWDTFPILTTSTSRRPPFSFLTMPAILPTVRTEHWKTDQLSPLCWKTVSVKSRLIVAHTHTQPRPCFPALSPCPACEPTVPPPYIRHTQLLGMHIPTQMLPFGKSSCLCHIIGFIIIF